MKNSKPTGRENKQKEVVRCGRYRLGRGGRAAAGEAWEKAHRALKDRGVPPNRKGDS